MYMCMYAFHTLPSTLHLTHLTHLTPHHFTYLLSSLLGALPSSQPQPLLPHPPLPVSTTPNQLPFFAPHPPPQIITPPKMVAVSAVPTSSLPPTTIMATPSVAPASNEAKPQASSTPMTIGTEQNSAPGE